MQNADVYVTGSNSRMLSSDIMTEFRGRGDEITVYPLSFSEYLPASGKSRDEAFNDYMLYGGLPAILSIETMERKASYLSDLFTEIYFRDIVERYRIVHEDILEELTDVLSSAAGSITNVNRLTNAINSMKSLSRNNAVSNATIKSYLEHLQDSFLFSRAKRYDIRGKEYFGSQSKFYPMDTGLRNARLNFRLVDPTRLMENAIYIYLRQKGFLVDAGMIEKNAVEPDGRHRRIPLEIDFIVNKGMYRYYIQSAFSMEDPEKERKELYPFSIVGNSFRKIVVTRNELLPHYDDGILHVGVIDFLLGDYLSG